MATDLRISTLPSVLREKVVLRLLGNDRDSSLIDVRRLGMDEKQEEIFGRMLKAPFGIILVTGPTGSGKSTTLYAALSQLAEKKINCVTVEDPVEKADKWCYPGSGKCQGGTYFCNGPPFYFKTGSGCDHGGRNTR